MVGFRPSPLSGLASSRVGSRRREAALWEMSLSIYRSTIRPISSGRIKSYTRRINPPPLFLPEFSTCMSFRLSKRFLYSSFLHHCLLLPFVILSACVCFLFHCAFFLFFLEGLFIDLSLQLAFLSPPSSLILCTSVIVIIACSLKVWPVRYISYEFLFCSSPRLYC